MSTINRHHSDLDLFILSSFRHNEWEPSFWFPRVLRDAVNFPELYSDAAVQDRIIDLIRAGELEVSIDDGETYGDTGGLPSLLAGFLDGSTSGMYIRTNPDLGPVVSNFHARLRSGYPGRSSAPEDGGTD